VAAVAGRSQLFGTGSTSFAQHLHRIDKQRALGQLIRRAAEAERGAEFEFADRFAARHRGNDRARPALQAPGQR
jgi:hypothetical protein